MATPKIDNQAAFSDVGWNLNYFMGLAIVVNVITVATIAFSNGGLAIYVPLTAVIVFMNVLAIIGLNATMDDADPWPGPVRRRTEVASLPELAECAVDLLPGHHLVGFAAALLAQLWSMYMA